MSKKAILIIMDGWGIGDCSASDVICKHSTYVHGLSSSKDCLFSHLDASGEDVGLPEGQMGNSEVGHLNIGAGRVVYQDLVRINKDIREGEFFKKQTLIDAFNYAKENNKSVHLIGLTGDGGVHSMTAHAVATCEMGTKLGVKNIFVHALMDGRDTDPRSGKAFMQEMLDGIKNTNAKVASVCGRYYTMDRDKRWERVKVGYDLMVHGTGTKAKDPIQAIQESYDADKTDEFINPIVITDDAGNALTTIKDNDVVICFNFRTDRLRQITTALTQQDFPDQQMKTIPLHYITMTKYDEKFKGVHVVYDKADLKNTLGEMISKAGKKQIRIAETEKYAHVTFFFSGGREQEFPGETRLLVNSPKVATYDLQPEMSAFEVKDLIVPELKKGEVDFVCLNFANGDMVGHTGFYDAIVKAIKTVDQCVKEVVEAAVASNYSVMIIADHGNADYAVNPDGSPNTAHSTNPVPCIVFNKEFTKLQNGKLCDVAPTILTMMGMDIPAEMDGKVLVSK